MESFTYTIFDDRPADCPDCAWPTHRNVAITARSSVGALRQAMHTARSEAEGSGAYAAGHRLWVLVWDESGELVQDGFLDLGG